MLGDFDPDFESHWGLRETPFSLAPNPRFLYLTPQHQAALNALILDVTTHRAHAVLVGPPGTGKTTLIRKLQQELDPTLYHVALQTDIHADAKAASRELALAVGCPEAAYDPGGPVSVLAGAASRLSAMGSHAVIVADEAQALEDAELVDALAELGGAEDVEHARATVIWVGEPPLLEVPVCGQALGDGVDAVATLTTLSVAEMSEMIQFRLRTAWYSGPPLLDGDAAVEIHSLTGGTPRHACELMDNALRYGAATRTKKIDRALVRRVMEELPGRPW